jgi:hypothetical protein
MSFTTFSPAAATQALLTEKTIPALNESQYQEWTEYLFSADESLRFAVAETAFRYNRQQPRALGLFLACAYPVAGKISRRLVFDKAAPDLIGELLYDGAVNAAITMFQESQIPPDDMSFAKALQCEMKSGAIRAAFRRTENTAIICIGTPNRRARTRLEQRLIAKEMLGKIAALEPGDHPRLNRFLRCLIEIGADAIWPISRRKKQWLIDFEPLMNKLGISRDSAKHYLCLARKLLREEFNPDGTLFIRSTPKSR